MPARPRKAICGWSPRPGHRLGEPRQRRRQLLNVRAGDAIQVPREHSADGRLLLIHPVLQHIDVMPWRPDAQLRAPDRLRQDTGRIVPERLRSHAAAIPRARSPTQHALALASGLTDAYISNCVDLRQNRPTVDPSEVTTTVASDPTSPEKETHAETTRNRASYASTSAEQWSSVRTLASTFSTVNVQACSTNQARSDSLFSVSATFAALITRLRTESLILPNTSRKPTTF